jgi:hypothetical protein
LASLDFPKPLFPDALDDDTNLFHVYNTSESLLSKIFTLEDDIIYIEPREFNEKEKFSHSGNILNLEGELLFYFEVVTENNSNPPPPNDPNLSFFDDPSISDEDKIQNQRVVAFKNLIRGINSTIPRVHLPGEWVRGYVMADHHNALKQALLGAETLIGVDNSIDRLSLDFRLRDLSELIVEKDDLDCPFGVFWYEIIDSNAQQETVQFHITVIGNADRIEFVPEKDGITITDDLNPIWTYGVGVDIEATLKVFSGTRCCSIIASSGVVVEPCEFAAIVPDIPEIVCPEIDIPDIPVIRPDITCICPELSCSITQCPPIQECEECIDADITPITFTIPTIPTEIILNLNTDISIQAPTIPIDINVNITFGDGTGNDTPGACFKLIVCNSTTS